MKSVWALKSNASPVRPCGPGSTITGGLPAEVVRAMALDWGVYIDAYLLDAARVGNRYAAIAFCDQSGASSNGMTVATPPVRHVATRGAFKLLQTLDGADSYVLVTEHDAGVVANGNGN
ncbi:hypothetical protein [Pseudomonas savastanoi]|uniref:Uncharacterized protein n=3 Tax=Pseudomonas savastanoi pv. glycinea TaxID=318 RepID=A0A0P9VTK6_PSESG|nr:hypothetical protein [Pseudomonas savastanoi]EFW80290.1 hypothetical protein PsgB076_13592 [Pseudomonas savastanoi pv. glycinea str. B076]EFW84629.1 hypothetical protein PsgRace4_18018 [Pseudomonas savastanoi pv. glycinea str. race 4]EGH16513.1 hypothetical protein Pgy4_26035 [Pseudomonas savastanoi pv. glycinea str. race 4]KPX41633.1 hypothetical protein ALO37_101807 [Pseudomonas savastanoi pv. glycinea]MCQ3007596.1 hypothetical protein [Pseudomonas savastanoi]